MQFTSKQLGNFFKKVNKTQSCWLWNGYRIWNGYGRVNLNSKALLAHRVSYLIHKGEIPGSMEVMHICDVRQCVNPDHLQVATHRDNMQDALVKGRNWNGNRAGSKNPNWKGGISFNYH